MICLFRTLDVQKLTVCRATDIPVVRTKSALSYLKTAFLPCYGRTDGRTHISADRQLPNGYQNHWGVSVLYTLFFFNILYLYFYPSVRPKEKKTVFKVPKRHFLFGRQNLKQRPAGVRRLNLQI